jgi:type IV secretory pathway TraG/TraD family ATPase VirD4
MREANRSAGGRLPVPLLAVLDEAANVVRWRDLPKQYSHFGSRGIVVMTMLQSWAQGVRAWGADGMNALWAAANIRVIGSGVDDTMFLRERSEAIGDYDSISKSTSYSSTSRSYSASLGSSRTLSLSELVGLPRGRAVVFPAGGKAAMVRTVPWWDGEYKEHVEASIANHLPGMRPTTIDDLVDQRSQLPDITGQETTREVPSL